MKTIKHPLYFAVVAITLLACGNSQQTGEPESGLIVITQQQFATDSMQLGEIAPRVFESAVKCNGTIVPLPEGMARVSVPVNGLVKGISCYNGLWVAQNQPLMEIYGNEVVDIQREYAEASASFVRIRNEYERIKSLHDEKVTSEKDFILAEADYKTSIARYNALKIRIEAVGLSAPKIEQGGFSPSYVIKSPIAGFISNLNTHIGSYIDSHTELLEIVNPGMLQVKLSVFPTDVKQLKKGQIVRFKSAQSSQIYQATMSTIGVVVDPDSKTIDCYAAIDGQHEMAPIVNDFIEAEIITSTDSIKSLPNDALIKTETGYVILVLEKQDSEKLYFRKEWITIGRRNIDYTEVLVDNLPGKVLVSGVYNLVVE
jgi:cobalt-zinc-cadmium efflux system membrane fusion protein